LHVHIGHTMTCW